MMVLIFTRVPAPNFRIPRSMTPVQEAPPNLASSVADQTQPTAAEPTAGAHEMSRLTPGKKSLSKGTAVEWAKYRLTEEATVVLHRPDLNTGLGVTLAKYPHDVPHPRIFELSKDGIAARSGLLKVKDVIVAVNGVSVNSDAAAAQVLQLTGLQITFTIRRTPSPLSAHQVHTPVQSGKARLNAAPASTEVTAEPWSEPEQPAYPLQLALASPPQSPTPIAFDRRGPPRAIVMPPDRPYSPSGSDVPSPTSTPVVKAGLSRRAPPGLPPAVAFGALDGEKAPASPKSDGTETSAESQAEAGLDGKLGPIASAKEIDFWGACHPLTASSAHTATRFASIQRLLPFTGWLAITIREISKPFAVCGPSLCAAPRKKDDLVPSPFKLWTSQAALTEAAAVPVVAVTLKP